ncbi:hypothetical protein [Mycolicibacterium austroafricanum]|uniref:hypothetical protein n=1 Tax=Mycolicibacterium austroafricanum TaxID=39687 RepID=UPI001CA37851|nr:hypothetical protein [Mycolicibacterium austroafricanum]QZT58425.1 hypothetical protein JN084_07475 [Mycolicibacterium austroafricanum]
MVNPLAADGAPPDIAVCFIVLAYRNPVEGLKALFSSLSQGAAAVGVRSQCVLVSNDDHFHGESIPEVEVYVGHGNVGFSAGIRIGVEAADADFVVIANPDLMISAADAGEFISALIRQDGVLIPVLQNVNGGAAYESYEDWVFSVGRQISERVCRKFVLDKTTSELPRWAKICGAFLGMPAPIAREFGPFDSKFFMYGEDRDLTRRLRRRKVPIRLLRGVAVTHHGGGSGSGMNRELAIFRADSALRVAYRRYGAMGVWLKGYDLWLEASLKRKSEKDYAKHARQIAVAHWRSHKGEAPRLDFDSVAQLAV